MRLLERLGEEERAAFVLHDVFDCDYDDIAETLGKTPAACRQLVHRARERVATDRRRFRVDEADAHRHVEAVHRSGADAATSMRSRACSRRMRRMTSDGGGKAMAVFRILLRRGSHRALVVGHRRGARGAPRHRASHRARQRRARPRVLLQRPAALGRDRSIPMASASTPTTRSRIPTSCAFTRSARHCRSQAPAARASWSRYPRSTRM